MSPIGLVIAHISTALDSTCVAQMHCDCDAARPTLFPHPAPQVGQFLSGVRVIKMYHWEEPQGQEIDRARWARVWLGHR